MKTHKKAFEAVMKIWGKKPLAVYGSRMSESVLSILCHIIKGEKVIAEKLEKSVKERRTKVEEGPVPVPVISPPSFIPSQVQPG